jgi:hypothetical protein
MTSAEWVVDPVKFLTPDETRRPINTARKRAVQAAVKDNKVAVRDYFIVHLAQ